MGWPPELARFERLASVAQVGGFRPPSTPRTSWYGGVLLGARGRSGPPRSARSGGVAQIRTDELPAAAPAPLDGVALVTVFLDLLDLRHWELRTYPSVDELVPLTEPEREEHDEWTQAMFPVRWKPRVEIPSRDDTPSELLDVYDEHGAGCDLDGFKVGGWPRAIQSETLPPGVELVIQIDSDEKAGLAIYDSGALWIGHSAGDGWRVDWQFH